MALNESKAERIRQRLTKYNCTQEKKIKGRPIFMLNHKMYVRLDIIKKPGMDRLMVRLGKCKAIY